MEDGDLELAGTTPTSTSLSRRHRDEDGATVVVHDPVTEDNATRCCPRPGAHDMEEKITIHGAFRDPEEKTVPHGVVCGPDPMRRGVMVGRQRDFTHSYHGPVRRCLFLGRPPNMASS